MALTTPATSRTDTFARAHGITVANLIKWNLPYFQAHRTCWLPLDTDFLTEPPVGHQGRDLIVRDSNLVINDDAILQVY